MFSKRGASNESAPSASPSPFVSARMLELRSEIERLNEALHDQLDLLQAHCQKLIDQKFGSEALLDQLEELEKKEAELQSQLVTAIKDLLVATQETRKSVLQDAQNLLTSSSYDSSSSDSSFSSSSSSNSSSMVSNSLLSRTSDLLSNSVGVNLSQISTQIYRGGSTRTALKSKRGDNPFMRSGSGGASGGGEENGGSLLHDISTWELQRGEINVLPELLGKGSFGCVNKGLLRGKHVAVKTITPNWASDKEVMEVLDDFRNECAVMSKALHPNVLLLMGVCIEQDQEQSKLLMVTELMPNGSVHSLIHNPKNKIPFKRRIRFAKDTALGMNYLHLSTPQIMHLDLKTQNLLVDAHYVAKVADFGLSRVKKAGSNKGATGSPLYMAPEVLADKPYDEKADVYSFGIVLWELVTQQKPFKEEAFETLEDIFQHVVIDGDRPEIPAACPPKLAELIKKCWHADPQVRPSFQAILESKILDDVIVDAMISDVNAEAREFWKEKFTSKEAIPEDSVDWKVFAKGLVEFLDLEYPQGTVLDNVLEFKVLRLCLADKQDKVTLENFAAVIEWFGPFTKKKSEKTGANMFLANMMTIASLGGFWGDISSQHAEVKMAGQKPGYYMIRFSSQQPGYFTISAMSKDNTLKHFRIKHRAGLNFLLGNSEYPSIKALLRKHKDDLYLKHAVKGSPYAQLFLHHDEGPQSAYVEMLLT